MPYAIIKTGGKQYRVESGRTYKLPSLVGEEGGKIEFNEVLLGNDGKNVKTGVPILSGAKVTGEIVRHGRGEKVVAGNIIIRQDGTKYHPGNNVGLGRDYTIFALIDGVEVRAQERQG